MIVLHKAVDGSIEGWGAEVGWEEAVEEDTSGLLVDDDIVTVVCAGVATSLGFEAWVRPEGERRISWNMNESGNTVDGLDLLATGDKVGEDWDRTGWVWEHHDNGGIGGLEEFEWAVMEDLDDDIVGTPAVMVIGQFDVAVLAVIIETLLGGEVSEGSLAGDWITIFQMQFH